MRVKYSLFWGPLLAVMVYSSFGNAGLNDILNNAQKALEGTQAQNLSQGDITAGLKEALEVGTQRAVQTVSQPNGYYQNANIKIPLPGPVENVEKILRTAGLGSQIDAFEQSMNRAAEKAAPKATSIFTDAIKQMRFADAKRILKGRDNEATLYFKEKTEEQLQAAFKPIVADSMSQVGVTRQYQDLVKQTQSIPFAKMESFDLDQYVTQKSVDGLFYMVAQEEMKIRQNPAARSTELLQKVFAN
jgi:hypothetical protein